MSSFLGCYAAVVEVQEVEEVLSVVCYVKTRGLRASGFGSKSRKAGCFAAGIG